MARDRIDRDTFMRGAPEGLATDRRVTWQASLYDLVTAYGRVTARSQPVLHQISRRPVVTLDAAIARVEAMVGTMHDWTAIAAFMPSSPFGGHEDGGDYRRSALASTVVAMLELARRGTLVLRQDAPFGPLLVKAA